jgi:hypothetical protein
VVSLAVFWIGGVLSVLEGVDHLIRPRGRWAVYRATWTSGDRSTLVTSWSELQSHVNSGELALVRAATADFRCPVLGNPEPIG